ncbi:MAG TPA: CinA family protein [Burkholderiaceae bacterium]|nr:CinA family protein [Burkholderiaceae bacterium]
MLSKSEQARQSLCRVVANLMLNDHVSLAIAESCTGGLIAAACTDLPGSSQWFERGFVTYSNAAKTELLGIDAALIQRDGAVSESVAIAMVQGAVKHSHARVAVAVTGIAGPEGGSVDKPVGTVWIAWNVRGKITATCHHFAGDRTAVREQTVQSALQGLIDRMVA